MSRKRLFEEFLSSAKTHGFRPTGNSPVKPKTPSRSVKSRRTGNIQYTLRLSGSNVQMELWFGHSNPANFDGYQRLMNATPPDGLLLVPLDEDVEAGREVLQIIFCSRPFEESPTGDYHELLDWLFQRSVSMRDFVERVIGDRF